MTKSAPLRLCALIAVFNLSASFAANAQEIGSAKQATEDTVAATLADVSWIIGDWEGRDSEGDRVMERWQEPIGDLMVGMFIQTQRDADRNETVDWSELLHLREANGSLQFTALTIQAGADPLIGPSHLVKIEPCALYFDNMLMRCADPEKPGEGMVVTYGDDALGRYTITYERPD